MTSSKRLVVLMKRRQRALVNHDDVLKAVQKFASETNRDVYVFDDTALPSFNETLTIFYRADVIFGPHGAGMTNMIFARPGTFVGEVQCLLPKYVRMCFRQLALKLGMRYYGTVTTRNSVQSKRCNKEGLLVNPDDVKYWFGNISSV